MALEQDDRISQVVTRERSRLRVWRPSGSPPPVGTQADWYLPADRCLWFDATGERIDV